MDQQFMNTPEYSELMSILQETKNEITKLQVNVQASADLKNLSYDDLSQKIDKTIKDYQKDETRSQYLTCLLSDMTQKSELNWLLYRKSKIGENFLSKDEESILSGIDWWRNQYLNEHIWDQSTRDKIKNLLKKLVKEYKENLW